MRVHQLDTTFTGKRTMSIISKFINPTHKSHATKENQSGELASTKKYIPGGQKEKLNQEHDQTEKFLQDTKLKLRASTKQLQEFCNQKLVFNSTKQKLDYSLLSNQIKHTKQKLKNKHHKQSLLSQTNHLLLQKSSCQNPEKLYLLEQVISPEDLTLFQEEISDKQYKIKQKYRDDPEMQKKLLRYFQNYQIIGRFLEEVAKDAQKLHVKKANIHLYYQMKDQMITLLSNEEFFTNHIRVIEQSEQNRDKSLLVASLFHQERFAKAFSRGRQNFPVSEQLMIERIEELMQTSKASIKDAFCKFNRPDLMYEIELQFNKRLNESNPNQ